MLCRLYEKFSLLLSLKTFKEPEEVKELRQIRDKDTVVFPQNVIVFDATHRLRGERKVNEDRTKTRKTYKFSPPLNVRQQKKRSHDEIGLNISVEQRKRE